MVFRSAATALGIGYSVTFPSSVILPTPLPSGCRPSIGLTHITGCRQETKRLNDLLAIRPNPPDSMPDLVERYQRELDAWTNEVNQAQAALDRCLQGNPATPAAARQDENRQAMSNSNAVKTYRDTVNKLSTT